MAVPPTAPAQQNELVLWFRQIPPVTRFLFSSTIIITLAGKFYSPMRFVLLWPEVFSRYQLWRPFTCFFLQAVNMTFLFNLYFLYKYSLELERSYFNGRTADYAWFIMVVNGLSLIASYFFDFIVLGEGLIMAIVYLWAKYHANAIVNFMFGMRFQATYLPWVLVLFHFVASNSVPYDEITGIVASHFYHFMVTVYPQMNPSAPRYLETPGWVKAFLSNEGARTGGFGAQPPPGAGTSTGASGPGYTITGHRWGSGQRLG